MKNESKTEKIEILNKEIFPVRTNVSVPIYLKTLEINVWQSTPMHIRMMTQPLQAAQANLTITQAVQPVLPQQQFLQQLLQQHQPHRPPRQLMEKPFRPQLLSQQYLKQSLRLYPQRHRQQNLWHRQQKI